MAQLDLAQVGFFKPILDKLQDEGSNIQKLLYTSRLSNYNLENANKYVPVQILYDFFSSVSHQEGIKDFIEEFSELIKLVSLSQWGVMIAYAPDILTACQRAEQYDSVVLTHEHAGFDINAENTTYWQYFDDEPIEGREQADFVSLALAVNGFQLAAGDTWAPLEIHIQSNVAPNLDRILPEGNTTKIYVGQPRTAIVFPTSMLSMPMLGRGSQKNLSLDSIEKFTSIGQKIECILESNQNKVMPGLQQIADVADMSPRTLQRKLVEESITYFEVVDKWRFKTALKLLENPSLKIKDISENLRYANVPNFERSFKRWTNQTPRQYREIF